MRLTLDVVTWRLDGDGSEIGEATLTRSTISRVAKRTTDLVLGSVLLVLALPVMALAAVAIWFGDGGPVLFAQERLGRGERPFRMLKFRTMIPGAEHLVPGLKDQNTRTGPLFKLRHDPRVTPVGRVLRVSSIDELPQLFNVVAGHMSLVGPRPALAAEVAHFDGLHRRRRLVRPGMTGLWQVSPGLHDSFEEYRALDLAYLDARSNLGDLVILGRTLGQVLRRLGQAVADWCRTDDDVDLREDRTVDLAAFGTEHAPSVLDGHDFEASELAVVAALAAVGHAPIGDPPEPRPVLTAVGAAEEGHRPQCA